MIITRKQTRQLLVNHSISGLYADTAFDNNGVAVPSSLIHDLGDKDSYDLNKVKDWLGY